MRPFSTLMHLSKTSYPLPEVKDALSSSKRHCFPRLPLLGVQLEHQVFQDPTSKIRWLNWYCSCLFSILTNIFGLLRSAKGLSSLPSVKWYAVLHEISSVHQRIPFLSKKRCVYIQNSQVRGHTSPETVQDPK